jgi:hypothetical protein
MAKLLLILSIAIVFEAIGVIHLSRGLKEIGELEAKTPSAVMRLVGRGVTNYNVVMGVFLKRCSLLDY